MSTITASPSPPSWLDRRCLRADPRPLLLLSLAIPFACFWWYRTPEVAMVKYTVFLDACYGFLAFAAIGLLRSIQLFNRASRESDMKLPRKFMASRRWFWPWFVLIIVGTVFLVQTRLPMRLAFLLSRGALDDIADQALADPANADKLAGRWAGLYEVAGVKVMGKTVLVYLDRDGGKFAFARVPGAGSELISHAGDPPGAESIPDFPPGDPCGQRLAADWFVTYSFYLSVKLGWS